MKRVLHRAVALDRRRSCSRRRRAVRATDPIPWFGTFSIIAFDPVTNELGVGVQSRAFGAGAAVPYAKPGVGAVATQASANRQYGPKAIALLEQGLSPAEVVKRITDEDPGRDTRQVAVIDTKGRSAVYTGKRVIDRNSDPKDLVHLGGYAGHVSGPNFSAQGNTLASEEVVKAMAAAYQNGKGIDGRAADGCARCRPGEGRRHARHAVRRHPRRAAAAAQLGIHRRTHRRHPRRRSRGAVQGAAPAARHDDGRAESAADAIAPSCRRQASTPRRLPKRRRRSRSIRAANRRCISWRAVMPRPATRSWRWSSCRSRSRASRSSGSSSRRPIRHSRSCERLPEFQRLIAER